MIEAMRRPVSGYGEITIVRSPSGPRFEGPVPERIGVYRALLDDLVPALGSWNPDTGILTLLEYRFRQIGVDGPDVYVFEQALRVPA